MKIPVLYGLTHTKDGELVVKVPRSVKVGIGLPKGCKMYVFLLEGGSGGLEWCIRRLEPGNEGPPDWKSYKFSARKEAESAWMQLEKGGVALNAPLALSHFVFWRMDRLGQLRPDWDLIEMHGPQPREIPVAFTDNAPLEQAYRWWSKTKLCCSGDGINALRHIDHAETPEQKEAAAAARARGDSHFQILGGAVPGGAPHAKEQTVERDGKASARRSECTVNSRLYFQLAKAPRIGSYAQYDSTGKMTALYLLGSLTHVATWPGGGDPARGVVAGFELNLILTPIKNQRFNGVKYAASVELADETLMALRRKLVEQAQAFDRLMVAGNESKQIEAPRLALSAGSGVVDIEAATDDDEEDEQFLTPEQDAALMHAEFSDGCDGEAEAEQRVTPSQQVEESTTGRAAALSDRVATIRAKRGGPKPAAPRAEDEYGVGPDDAAPATEGADPVATPPPPPPEPAGLFDAPPAVKPNGAAFRQPVQRTTSKGGWE